MPKNAIDLFMGKGHISLGESNDFQDLFQKDTHIYNIFNVDVAVVVRELFSLLSLNAACGPFPVRTDLIFLFFFFLVCLLLFP